MPVPLEIVFRDVAPYKEAVEAEIRKRAGKLDRFYAQILKCRVVVEAPHRHRREGMLYQVRMEVSVPGRKIVVSTEHRRSETHKDIFVAVRDAFDAAEGQLEGYSQLARGEVKDHDTLPHGTVREINREAGFGFIEGYGGREIYFHRNSALDGFDSLGEGDEVRFEEEPGEKGPQATSVKLIRKGHAHHRGHQPPA
ncbi:MAG: HPF/RaiA family ribosome-associated protein [Thermodesulfovibrionales bacterium]